MTERIIGNQIRLIPYYRNDAVSLLWYRDRDVCKQVDSRDAPYDVELLRRMYDYLSTRGDCCYIEYEGTLVGDVSLQNNVKISIFPFSVVMLPLFSHWKSIILYLHKLRFACFTSLYFKSIPVHNALLHGVGCLLPGQAAGEGQRKGDGRT